MSSNHYARLLVLAACTISQQSEALADRHQQKLCLTGVQDVAISA
jgi:hypothetical protein